jgi:hypothetical protein
MGDADGAFRLTVLGPFGTDLVGEAGDLAYGPQGQDGIPFLDRQSSGVITAIFETPQPAEQDGCSGVSTDISDDSAHRRRSYPRGERK